AAVAEPVVAEASAVETERAAALVEAATSAETRATALERALRQTRQQLDEVETARRAAIEARDGFANRLKDSEARARPGATRQSQQDESLRRLAEETRRSLGEVERILNATGIDAARRARLGRDASPGKDTRPGKDKLGATETDKGTAEGGPFVAWSRHRQA